MGFLRCSIITLILFSTTVQAKNLTWKEAIDLASKNSLELQAAISNYKSAESLETGSYSGFLPKLSASLSETHSGAPSTASSRTYAASLNVSQNLFAGFSDVNNYFLRSASTRSAQTTLTSIKARLSQELQQAYAETFYIQDYKKLSADIYSRRKENARSIKLQYEVGRENKGSVLQSESYVEQASLDLLSAEHQEEEILENLKRLLGVANDEPLQLVDRIDEKPIEPLAKPDFNYLATQNPDVLSALADEESSIYALRISRSHFSPSLDVSGSYSYSDTKYFPENDRWSIGLTLSLPLFDGFKDYASTVSNKYKKKNFEDLSKSKVQTVALKLRQAYNDFVEAVIQEKIDNNFSKAAVLRADIARNKYKNGFLSFEDWDIIETDLISKQKSFLSSQKNKIIKKSIWEQAQGIGVLL